MSEGGAFLEGDDFLGDMRSLTAHIGQQKVWQTKIEGGEYMRYVLGMCLLMVVGGRLCLRFPLP